MTDRLDAIAAGLRDGRYDCRVPGDTDDVRWLVGEVRRLRGELSAAEYHRDGARATIEQLERDLAALRERHAELEADVNEARSALWAGHGHRGLYGDDGEMQCAECGRGAWDYKRFPLAALVVAALAALRERHAEAVEAAFREGHACGAGSYGAGRIDPDKAWNRSDVKARLT